MIPSILLGGEEHLVIRRKIKRAVRGEFGEGIVGCVSTMPNFFSIAGRGVCNPNRPWRYADRNEWKLLLQTGKTHKGNALAIRRPPWADVAISARRQIANAVAAEIVNGDEAMIAPAADKCYFASIGRPPRAGVFTPQIRELMSRSCPGYRSNPQLLVRSPSHSAAALRRDQVRGKWRAHHLLESEVCGRTRERNQRDQQTRDGKRPVRNFHKKRKPIVLSRSLPR